MFLAALRIASHGSAALWDPLRIAAQIASAASLRQTNRRSGRTPTKYVVSTIGFDKYYVRWSMMTPDPLPASFGHIGPPTPIRNNFCGS
jgi:hypothetical protein